MFEGRDDGGKGLSWEGFVEGRFVKGRDGGGKVGFGAASLKANNEALRINQNLISEANNVMQQWS